MPARTGKLLLRAAGLPHVAEGVEVETHLLEPAADGLHEALGPGLRAREDPEPRVRMADARAAAARERLRRGPAADRCIARGLVTLLQLFGANYGASVDAIALK